MLIVSSLKMLKGLARDKPWRSGSTMWSAMKNEVLSNGRHWSSHATADGHVWCERSLTRQVLNIQQPTRWEYKELNFEPALVLLVSPDIKSDPNWDFSSETLSQWRRSSNLHCTLSKSFFKHKKQNSAQLGKQAIYNPPELIDDDAWLVWHVHGRVSLFPARM